MAHIRFAIGEELADSGLLSSDVSDKIYDATSRDISEEELVDIIEHIFKALVNDDNTVKKEVWTKLLEIIKDIHYNRIYPKFSDFINMSDGQIVLSEEKISQLKNDLLRDLLIDKPLEHSMNRTLNKDESKPTSEKKDSTMEETKRSISEDVAGSVEDMFSLLGDNPSDIRSKRKFKPTGDGEAKELSPEAEELIDEFDALNDELVFESRKSRRERRESGGSGLSLSRLETLSKKLEDIEKRNNSLKAIDVEMIESTKRLIKQRFGSYNKELEKRTKERDSIISDLRLVEAERDRIKYIIDYIKSQPESSETDDFRLLRSDAESSLARYDFEIEEGKKELEKIEKVIASIKGEPIESAPVDGRSSMGDSASVAEVTPGSIVSLEEQFDKVLERVKGREIETIGLEELRSIKSDMDSLVVTSASEDLAKRISRLNADIDREIDVKTNLLDHFSDEELAKLNASIAELVSLVEETRKGIEGLEKSINNSSTPEAVKEKYESSRASRQAALNDQVTGLNKLKAKRDEFEKNRRIINTGGKLDLREPIKLKNEAPTLINPSLTIDEQVNVFRRAYSGLLSRYEGKRLDHIGIIALKEITDGLERIYLDIDVCKEIIKGDEASIKELDKIYEEARSAREPLYEKYKEKFAIGRDLVKRKVEIKEAIRNIENEISNNRVLIEKTKIEMDSATEPSIKEKYARVIENLENSNVEHAKKIAELVEELNKINKAYDAIRFGGAYKSLVGTKKSTKGTKSTKSTTKSTKKKPTTEKDGTLTPPPAIKRPVPGGLPTDVAKVPHVKYNKPKLTWKTALAVATGIGIGATVFFVAGPTGVAVMSIVNSVALKFVGSARAKAAASKMTILGGEEEVESIEEPKKGIKGAAERFRKYIRSEEGLRDISWMLTSAIITGNALSISSAIRSKIVANNTPHEVVTEPPASTTTTTTSTPAEVTHVEPISTHVTPVQPAPTNNVYSGIRLGDNVGSYNVSVGHRQATKAFGGWDPLHLNQHLVNSDSVFSEFAIVDDTGKLIGRVGTPGLTLDEVCAQYGVNYSNIVLDVAKNGTPQAWISVEELVKGVTMGGPTI